MPLNFNTLLNQFGIVPSEVVLLRHWERFANGQTPYELLCDDLQAFELYQSVQGIQNRPKLLRSKYWASFVRLTDGSTLLAGIYSATYKGLLQQDRPRPYNLDADIAGQCDEYELVRLVEGTEFERRLAIDWGDGARAWIQRADRQNKSIVELRAKIEDPKFPGFLNFLTPLSQNMGGNIEQCQRDISADLSEDEGAICRLGGRV